MVTWIAFAKRDRFRIAIHGRSRSKHEGGQSITPASPPNPSYGGIQQIQRPVDIHVAVEMGILNRNSNPGHRRQVNNSIKFVRRKEFFHGLPVSNVSMDKREGFSQAALTQGLADFLQIGAFPGRVIIVVQVIQTHNPISPGR